MKIERRTGNKRPFIYLTDSESTMLTNACVLVRQMQIQAGLEKCDHDEMRETLAEVASGLEYGILDLAKREAATPTEQER